MTKPDFYGPIYTYIGPASSAYPGIYTNTTRYLGNTKISYINTIASSPYSYLDDSFSNILVFSDTQ